MAHSFSGFKFCRLDSFEARGLSIISDTNKKGSITHIFSHPLETQLH